MMRSTTQFNPVQKFCSKLKQPAAILLSVLLLSGFSAPLLAAPDLKLKVKAEMDVVVEENGVSVKKRVPVTEAEPGQEIIYTLSYRNAGDEAATNIKLKDKIPTNTTYVVDSAFGEGADILFSIDDAKNFKKPSLLQYAVKTGAGKAEQKTATPETYTHIQWIIKQVAPGAEGTVGYRVLVN